MKVTRKTRFMFAATIWTLVAVSLIGRGLFPYFGNIDSASTKGIALLLAVLIGVPKGLFVISKSTERTANYIARRPEKDWIWMSFHPVLYLLIPLMIAMGLFLRKHYGHTNPELIVGVYVAIGLALLVGVRGFGRAYAATKET